MTGPGGEAREVLRPTRLLGDSTGITRVPPVVLDTTGPQWRRFTPSVAIQTNHETLCTRGCSVRSGRVQIAGYGSIADAGPILLCPVPQLTIYPSLWSVPRIEPQNVWYDSAVHGSDH